MANIINPYRFSSSGGGGGGSDYVTISTSATVTTDSYDYDYKYIEFDSTTTSAFEVTDAGSSSGSDSIEVYVIGGGGAGSAPTSGSTVGASGGGGAGGYIRQTAFTNASSLLGTYDVTVGAGGTTSGGTSNTAGADSQVVKQGERSISFDGSNDYIQTATSSDFTFGTGSFTIELWFKPSSGGTSNLYKGIMSDETYSSTGSWSISQRDKELTFWAKNTSGNWVNSGFAAGNALQYSKWQHIAVSYDSGSTTTRMFVDGKQVSSGTTSGWNLLGDQVEIGRSTSTQYVGGQMHGIRVVKGSAVYTAAFNPSMEKLTAITNTKLLINPTTSQSTWTDSSASGHTLTGSGWSNFSSSLDSETPLMRAFGGGAASSYAGSYTGDKLKGGSGGGGSYSTVTGPAGFNGQGNKGGDRGSNYHPGGGGGAGSAGYSGSSTKDGGDALEVSWMANEYLGYDGDGKFAGGGGGALGGVGGGAGAGDGGDSTNYASDAEANSGGGGGGDRITGASGGTGGSGKVIVRWKYQN